MPKGNNGQETVGTTGRTSMELLAWWNAFNKEMENKGIQLSDGLLTDRNRLVCRTDPQSPELTSVFDVPGPDGKTHTKYKLMLETLYTMAASGRLFLYGVGERMPRRVMMEGDKPLITSPVDQIRQEIPEAHPLTGWRWFANWISGGRFYREEQQAYEDALARREALERQLLDEIPEGFDRGAQADNEAQRRQQERTAREEKEIIDRLADEAEEALDGPNKIVERTMNLIGPRPTGKEPFQDGNLYEAKPYTVPEGFTEEESILAIMAASFTTRAGSVQGGSEGDTPEYRAYYNTTHIMQDILTMGRDHSYQYFPVVDEGRRMALEAMGDYAKGDPEPLGKILGEGMSMLVRHLRTMDGIGKLYARYVDAAQGMLDLLNKDERLMAASGVTEEQKLELKEAWAIRGAEVKRNKAFRTLAQAARDGKELTREERMDCLTDICTANTFLSMHMREQTTRSVSVEYQNRAMEAAKRFKKQADISGYIEYDTPPTMVQQSLSKNPGQMETIREQVRQSGKLQELADLDTRSLAMEMEKVRGGKMNEDPVAEEVRPKVELQQPVIQKEQQPAQEKGTTVEQDEARKAVEKETGKKVEKDDPAVQQKLTDIKEAKREAARDVTAPERPTEKTEEKVKEVKFASGGNLTAAERSRKIREQMAEAYMKNPAAAKKAGELLHAKNALQRELGIPLLPGDPRIGEKLKEMRAARKAVEQEYGVKNISLNDSRITEKLKRLESVKNMVRRENNIDQGTFLSMNDPRVTERFQEVRHAKYLVERETNTFASTDDPRVEKKYKELKAAQKALEQKTGTRVPFDSKDVQKQAEAMKKAPRVEQKKPQEPVMQARK